MAEQNQTVDLATLPTEQVQAIGLAQHERIKQAEQVIRESEQALAVVRQALAMRQQQAATEKPEPGKE